nr:hypothetical protein [Arthrospira sp. SH-MAG29]
MTVAQLPADYLYRYFLTPSTQSRFPPLFLMAAAGTSRSLLYPH